MCLSVVRVVIIGIFAVLTGGQQLQIRPEQPSHTKAIGNSMLLTCEAKNASGDVDIKWVDNRNQEILARNGRLYIEDDTKHVRKLYITTIQSEDAGKYSCQAKIDGVDQERNVYLEIFRDITFEDFPKEQHPKIHTDALISCVVTGQPVPVVSWRNKGTRLRDGERYSITENGLIIRNITESDNGEYTCRGEVETDGRYSESMISVTVYIPPTITKAPGDVEAEQGALVSLACEADGLPKPEYKFYKDGGDMPLKSSENIEISETDGSIRFMSLKKVDEGSYTCNATNSVGYNTGVGKVKVLVKPTIARFQDVVGVQDKEVTVTCISEGDPPPTMTIRKEGTTEVYQNGSNEDERVTVSSSQPGQLQLIIRNLTIEDAGRYICNAVNKVGSMDKNATVTVHFKPRFTEERKEIYNWAGKTRNLTCEPLGEPAPSVEWVRADTILKNNNTFLIYESERSSTLQVTVRKVDQSWIYGDYFCRARNDYGEAQTKLEMKRGMAPDMPHNVSVMERAHNALVLEVYPPENDGGVTISGYNVEYREKIPDLIPLVDEGSAEANDTEVEVTTYVMTSVGTSESTDRNIRVEKLKANTTYTFKVRARNEVGLGKPYEFSANTDAFKKPQPVVINSNNLSKYPFEYTVTWEDPKTGGKTIQQYKFSIRKVLFNTDTQMVEELSDSPWSEQTVKDSSDIRSHTFKDLSPSTHYQLKIRVANEIGWSEPTNEFMFSTSKDPNAIPSSTPEKESTTGPVVAMTTDGRDGDEEGGEESKDADASSQQAQAGTGLVVGIVLAVFIVFLIIVDVSCYFLNSCGLTMFLCGKLCKKESPYAKEKTMEEGESNEVAKQPLPDDENAAATEKSEGEQPQDQLTSDQDSHHDKKPLLDSDETKEVDEEHLNKPREEKDEELKEPLKDEIPLEHPKAVKNEEADTMKKPEVTGIA